MVQFAEAAAKQFVDPTGAASAKIRKGLDRELEALPVSALAEFIAKSASNGELFRAARELEAQAFAAELHAPSELKAEIKLVLGVLADVGSINRQRLFSLKVTAPSETASVQDNRSDLFQDGSK